MAVVFKKTQIYKIKFRIKFKKFQMNNKINKILLQN